MVSAASAVAIQSYHNDYNTQSGNHFHQYSQPAIIKKVVHADVHHEQPANYEFKYDVHDEHTGDIKSQQESAKDGKITGYYTLIEPDGHRRIVHYTADDHHGFEAKVEREFVGVHHAESHHNTHQSSHNAHQEYHHAAPQVHKIIAPVKTISYSAPQEIKYVQSSHSAPSHHYTSLNSHHDSHGLSGSSGLSHHQSSSHGINYHH